MRHAIDGLLYLANPRHHPALRPANGLAGGGHLDDVRLMTSVFELAAKSEPILIESIRTGLPARAFAQVAAALKVPRPLLAKKLRIGTGTLNRKHGTRRTLSSAASEKLLRVARVRNLAHELLRNDKAVAEWLARPAGALGNHAPLDLLDTGVGAMQVEGFIRGLLHGNFQ